MKKILLHSIKQITIIDAIGIGNLTDDISLTFFPIIYETIKGKYEIEHNKDIEIEAWQKNVNIQSQTIKSFIFQSLKDLCQKKHDIIILLCDYNQRQKKFILMINTFFSRARFRIAIYSNNEFDIITLKYIISIIIKIIISFFKSFFLKIFFGIVLIFSWFFSFKKPSKNIAQ